MKRHKGEMLMEQMKRIQQKDWKSYKRKRIWRGFWKSFKEGNICAKATKRSFRFGSYFYVLKKCNAASSYIRRRCGPGKLRVYWMPLKPIILEGAFNDLPPDEVSWSGWGWQRLCCGNFQSALLQEAVADSRNVTVSPLSGMAIEEYFNVASMGSGWQKCPDDLY